MLFLIGCVAVSVGLFLYGLGYMFLMGSSPGDHPALDSFIKSTLSSGSGKSSGMMDSILTFGYVKATFRRFFATYRAYFTMDIAQLGKKAPDATVSTLCGESRTLHSIFQSVAKGTPIVLNCGSYT
jgi:hypothetical protein